MPWDHGSPGAGPGSRLERMRSRKSARTASSTLISNLSTGTTVVPAARVWRRLARPVAEDTAERAGRTHRNYTGSCSMPLHAGASGDRDPVQLRLRSTLSLPLGVAPTTAGAATKSQGGSLGSEGRLDDALDGVTVTEIRTKRAVLEDGVDEQSVRLNASQRC